MKEKDVLERRDFEYPIINPFSGEGMDNKKSYNGLVVESGFLDDIFAKDLNPFTHDRVINFITDMFRTEASRVLNTELTYDMYIANLVLTELGLKNPANGKTNFIDPGIGVMTAIQEIVHKLVGIQPNRYARYTPVIPESINDQSLTNWAISIKNTVYIPLYLTDIRFYTIVEEVALYCEAKKLGSNLYSGMIDSIMEQIPIICEELAGDKERLQEFDKAYSIIVENLSQLTLSFSNRIISILQSLSQYAKTLNQNNIINSRVPLSEYDSIESPISFDQYNVIEASARLKNIGVRMQGFIRNEEDLTIYDNRY